MNRCVRQLSEDEVAVKRLPAQAIDANHRPPVAVSRVPEAELAVPFESANPKVSFVCDRVLGALPVPFPVSSATDAVEVAAEPGDPFDLSPRAAVVRVHEAELPHMDRKLGKK